MCLFVTEFDSLEVILCRLTDRLNPAVSFFSLLQLLYVFVLCVSESEKRLRRNLKKTKALLADAGTMLAKQKNIEGAKQQIAQLRNQVMIG